MMIDNPFPCDIGLLSQTYELFMDKDPEIKRRRISLWHAY
jgi:hypothetical protein